MAERSGTRARMVGLDGARGLGVVAMLLYHADIGVLPGAFLTISMFFTLSGFLITGLLLAERRRTGTISVGAFWARRFRRLLPAALIALAGIALFGATVADGDQLRDLRGDTLAALGYVANWRFLFDGRDYLALFNTASPAHHFWSLAIEEQFYLLFPLVVFALLRLGRGRLWPLGLTLGAMTVGSVVVSYAVADADPMRVYYGTDTRLGEILVGALLAVVCVRWTGPRSTAGRRVLGVAGFVALAIMIALWFIAGTDKIFWYRGSLVGHALIVAVLLAAVRFETPVTRVLSWRPIVLLGLITYGVYLYHWPIFLWLSPERVGLPDLPLLALRLVVTISVAVVSYNLIECPIREGRRITGSWPRLVTPAATTAVVVALVFVTASPPAPEFVLAPVAATNGVDDFTPPSLPPAAESPSPSRSSPEPGATTVTYARPLESPRPVRALVVGDSVGLTFGRGLELWAAETGRAQVRNEAIEWCALGRELPRASALGEQGAGEGCEQWDERWPRVIEEFDPDVVFVLYTMWEVTPRKLRGASEFTVPGDPEHDAWQLAEYQAAADVLSERGAVVDWFTIPCFREPIHTGEPFWYVNRRILDELALSRASVRVLDLDAELCPDGTVPTEYRGVPAFRPDDYHFSDAGAFAVASWAMEHIETPAGNANPVQ